MKQTIGLCIVVAATSASSASWALDEEARIALGRSEYMGHCAACHGEDGKGAGPVAEVLTQRPSDLTAISVEYGGTFPAEQVYRVISGMETIDPHGNRQMPVWGPRFWIDAEERAQSVPHDVDARAMVHGRISALVEFIELTQVE